MWHWLDTHSLSPATQPDVGCGVSSTAPVSAPCNSVSSQAAAESSQAAVASSTSDEESPCYATGDDRVGDWNVDIMGFDYGDPLGTDWSTYKYPIAEHFLGPNSTGVTCLNPPNPDLHGALMNKHCLPYSRGQLSANWKAWLSSHDYKKLLNLQLKAQKKITPQETDFDSLPVFEDE